MLGELDDMDEDVAPRAPLNGAPRPRRDSRSVAERRAATLSAFVLEFGPFVIAAVLLVLASLANDIPAIGALFPNSHVGIYVCVAFVALLAFVVRLTNRQVAVEAITAEVVETTQRAVDNLQPDIEAVGLTRAFQKADVMGTTSDHVRIFAITSRFVSQQLRGEDIPANCLSLMVAGNTASDTRMPRPEVLESEVEIAVEYSWASRVRNGHIGTLNICQYEFFPTEWYVIFDDRVMVFGTYAFDIEAVGCAAPLNSVCIVHAVGAGRELIRAKIEAFDRLMKASSARIGQGSFEGEYQLIDGKVAHRRTNDDEWREMPNISQTTPV
jgi:hypothetical protein